MLWPGLGEAKGLAAVCEGVVVVVEVLESGVADVACVELDDGGLSGGAVVVRAFEDGVDGLVGVVWGVGF